MIQEWTTYDGRKVTMKDMSNQHMSNIHHFINTVVPQYYDTRIRFEISMWLQTRFDGIILSYKPVSGFKQEKTYLKLMGYIKKNNDIIVNNELIGKYEESSRS